MSLLNDVLRDIDQRRRIDKEQQISTSILVSEEPVQKKWFLSIVLVVAIIGISILAYSIFNIVKLKTAQLNNTLYSEFELPSASKALSYTQAILPQLAVSSIESSKAIELAKLRLELPTKTVKGPARTAAPSQRQQPLAPADANVAQADAPARVRTQLYEIGLNDLILKTPQSVVEQLLLNNITLKMFLTIFDQNIAKWSIADAQKSLAGIKITGRSLDDLALLLEINQSFQTMKNVNRSADILKIYGQLRLKSSEPGYWAFQQAVLLDKTGNGQKAYHYYKQAIQSPDINQRQNKLSRLRLRQLHYQLRQ